MADTKKIFDKEEFKKSIISNCKTLYRKNFDEADKQQQGQNKEGPAGFLIQRSGGK